MIRMAPHRREHGRRTPSRHPYQVWSLGMLFLAGTAAIVAPQPPSVAALLPTWQRILWSALILIACAIGLIAAWWRDPATGLLAERAGHAGLAGASFAYAIAIIVVVGVQGIVPAALLLGLTVAAIRRVIDIGDDLKTLERLAPGPSSDHLPPASG